MPVKEDESCLGLKIIDTPFEYCSKAQLLQAYYYKVTKINGTIIIVISWGACNRKQDVLHA